MDESINLAEARKKLPELTDLASAGHTYIFSRRGRELAVLMGIDEYRRLKALEEQQLQKDFDILLAPPPSGSFSEEEARQFAVEIVRDERRNRSASS